MISEHEERKIVGNNLVHEENHSSTKLTSGILHQEQRQNSYMACMVPTASSIKYVRRFIWKSIYTVYIDNL